MKVRTFAATIIAAIALLAAAPAGAAEHGTITERRIGAVTTIEWTDGHHDIRVSVNGDRALVVTSDPRERERYAVTIPTAELRELLDRARAAAGH